MFSIVDDVTKRHTSSKMVSSHKGPPILAGRHSLTDREVYWLSDVFYRSAFYVAFLSWVICLAGPLLMLGIPIQFVTSTSAQTSDHVENTWDDENRKEWIWRHVRIFRESIQLRKMEMRDSASAFIIVACVLRMWPQTFSQIQLHSYAGRVIKRRNRVAQTTGPYLKKFRQGLRHLAEVTETLRLEKEKLARRRKKVYTKYSMAEETLLRDIRSKEKLIGFLRTQMQCQTLGLKEVTSSVKVSRDRLEVQREENKSILDQLEYFAQIAQFRS
ncbi:uncharacterized protein LOC124276675 [Haliotis rubra]|uniref:uncharacterized protein LOC124276675 n=1 Tax=Haliotis rubra TaxID=36100 RepID=UPI001EE539FE|nr:uncharacterized protein LOC124276675 [Haliotis rubra]